MSWLEAQARKSGVSGARPTGTPSLRELVAECATLEEALELMRPHLPHLVFEPDVAKGLKRAELGRNRRNLRELPLVLRTLNELAEAYHGAEPAPRSLGLPLEEWVRARENAWGVRIPKITNHESESTMGMHGNERAFGFDGAIRTYERHATTIEGDAHSLHVFWEYGEDRPVIHVGYIGPHLSYASADT